MAHITIAEHHDGELSCMYGWDTQDVDRQDVKLTKVKVHSGVIDHLKSCNVDKVKAILEDILKYNQ